MIKIKKVSGLVEIEDKVTMYRQTAINNLVLRDDRKFHYEIRAHDNSELTMILGDPDKFREIHLKPGQNISITNEKTKARNYGMVKLLTGNIWAWAMDKFGNPYDWSKEPGSGGGVRG